MSKSWKKWSIIAGIASLAAILLIGGGIVGGILSGVIPVGAQEPHGEGPPFGRWHGHGMVMARGGHGAGLDTAAEVLGMTPEELRAELQAGKSLAEVAEEQGVDSQAVCDAMQAQREETLQQAVADGRLTQEEADSILERMAEHEGDCLSLPGGRPGFGGAGMGWKTPGARLDTAAEVLGMTPEELRAELQAGKSLAEVADEQGVDPQAICDAAHAQRAEMLEQAVADGRLTQEEADSILERMAEHEGDCLSAPGGPFAMRQGRSMGLGWGGHGAVLDTAAEVLGMTPEELRAELQAGKSLAEVADEQGVDPQAICDAAHAQREETLEQAVADGRLTQEEADSILERMAEREGDCLSMTGKPLGFGGAGRGGLGSGGHMGCPQEQ